MEKSQPKPQKTKKSASKGGNVPMYLGYFSNDLAKGEIENLCASVLQLCASSIEDKEHPIHVDLKAIESFSKPWSVPADPHVTTLFMGKRAPTDPKKLKIFESFEDGKKEEITVHAVAYIPGGIATGITLCDRDRIAIDNDFDHMTLMTAGLAAKYSNDLLEALFESDGHFANHYADKLANIECGKVYQAEVIVKGQKSTAFLVRLEKPWSFIASSKRIY